MTASGLPEPIDRLDVRITGTLAQLAVPALRIALGIVFFGFGVLKFLPNLSPAEVLAARTIEQLTFGMVHRDVALPVLATWETLIGLGLIAGRWLRAVLFLLAVQMVGTFTPLVLFPAETFTVFPFAPRASTSSRTSCSSAPRWRSAPRFAAAASSPSHKARPGRPEAPLPWRYATDWLRQRGRPNVDAVNGAERWADPRHDGWIVRLTHADRRARFLAARVAPRSLWPSSKVIVAPST